jgi:lambda family phage portal protein
LSFIRSIANRFGWMHKSQFRAAVNGFQAAALSRLTNDWSTGTLSADAQARNDLKTLIARCRDLRDNFDYAKKFLSMAKNNVLGTGVHFKNKAKDPDIVEGGRLIPGRMDVYANKLIEDARYEWSKKENCTVTRDTSLYDVEKIILESVVTDGGIIVRMVRGFDNPFRYALQLFDIDYIDFELNVSKMANGHEIKMGVEFNAWGERVNYYLLARNPNDSYYGLQNYGPRHVVLPARDVIHPFIKYRPRQTHGIPWMVTPAQRMKMLAGYEEAELVASRAAAAKGLFLKQTGDAEYQGPDDGAGSTLMDIEPGSAEILPQGLEPFVYDPNHPNSTYPQVVKAWLRGAAAGLNVSYHTLANDMEAVNFASGMIGLGEERDAWRCIQDWFIEDFEEVNHTNWLEMALLSGSLGDLPMSKFKKFNTPCFSGRRWEFVNPSVEVTAIKELLALRLTSVTRELAKKNIDRDELFQEIEEERREMERRKIVPEEVLVALKEAAGETDKGPSKEDKTLEFKQKAWLGFQADGTVSDVMANLTDIGALTEAVGIPTEPKYVEPWLPVMADNGQPVTGEVLKDSEGDIVGGEAEEPPEPTLPANPGAAKVPAKAG